MKRKKFLFYGLLLALLTISIASSGFFLNEDPPGIGSNVNSKIIELL